MNRWSFSIITLFFSLNCFGFQQSNFSAFIYHRFSDDRYPSTNISLDNFEKQLIYLKENNFTILTFGKALDRIQKRKKGIPIAVITIDDAYKSFYKNGWPLLKKYGFTATLYVNTETVGSGDFMTWEEINEVNAAGIEIGNHSHGHPYFLNDFSVKAFTDDLLTSHNIFKEKMGQLPKGYAYPFGEWNQKMADTLDKIGYDYATAQNSGPIYKRSAQFHLPRFPMSDDYADLDAFKQKLNVEAMEIEEIKLVKEGYLGSKTKPRLLLRFNEANYDLKSLQCFIQGTTARKSVKVLKNSRVELSMWPETDLGQRRTLFTVTLMDLQRQWHWFSYLYVQPN